MFKIGDTVKKKSGKIGTIEVGVIIEISADINKIKQYLVEYESINEIHYAYELELVEPKDKGITLDIGEGNAPIINLNEPNIIKVTDNLTLFDCKIVSINKYTIFSCLSIGMVEIRYILSNDTQYSYCVAIHNLTEEFKKKYII